MLVVEGQRWVGRGRAEHRRGKCLCAVYRYVGLADPLGEANNFESEITSHATKVKPETFSLRATVCTLTANFCFQYLVQQLTMPNVSVSLVIAVMSKVQINISLAASLSIYILQNYSFKESCIFPSSLLRTSFAGFESGLRQRRFCLASFCIRLVKLLKTKAYFMYCTKFCVLRTIHVCVLCESQNKQRLFLQQ